MTAAHRPHDRDPRWDRHPAAEPPGPSDPELDLAGFAPTPPSWTPRAGRRGAREKLTAGLRGLKYAVRGDSSFFAHAYRGLLVALTAALLGVGPMGWCLLIFGGALVFLAETTHSAVDTLARALGDPEEPGLTAAREIATGGVLLAVVVAAGIAITVLTLKFGDLLGWWG